MSFNSFSTYRFQFDRLDKQLSNLEDQKKYHDKWMKKYSEIFKHEDQILFSMEWDLRCRKALREIFSSATFYHEAKINLENRCFSSYYFCLYYSLFHAIYSCVFLDTECKISELIKINHSKIIKCFISAFANTKKDIMSRDVECLFQDLKYRREYYSYVTPFNNLFDYVDDLKSLEPILLDCYQLAAMHSLFIENSYKKQIHSIKKIKSERDIYIFKTLFNSIFSNEVPNKTIQLDPASKYMKFELLKFGFKPQYISLDLDHQYDEFHTYDKFYEDTSTNNTLCITEIWNFIAQALWE